MATLRELTVEQMEFRQFALDPDCDPQILEDTFEGMKGEYNDKINGCCTIISEIDGDIATFKKEKDRIDKIIKGLESNKKRITNSIEYSMKTLGQKDVSTGLYRIWYKKNPPHVVLDVDADDLPIEYIAIAKTTANLDAIGKALKADAKLPEDQRTIKFAHLESSESFRID